MDWFQLAASYGSLLFRVAAYGLSAGIIVAVFGGPRWISHIGLLLVGVNFGLQWQVRDAGFTSTILGHTYPELQFAVMLLVVGTFTWLLSWVTSVKKARQSLRDLGQLTRRH